jgi:hypothetical protein
MDKILVGPRSKCGRCGEERNLLPLPGIELRFLRRPSYSLLTILTELSWRKSESFCSVVRNLLAGMQEYKNIQRKNRTKQREEIQ